MSDPEASEMDRPERGALVAGVAGALGFLTRVPVGHGDGAWSAFTDRPATAVVPGYVVGVLTGAVLAGGLAVSAWAPAGTVAFGYVLAVYALVGINNLDGVADCGDAAVVHGDPAERRAVLGDTTTGVGAVVAVALVVLGLALGASAVLSTGPVAAFAVVLAAEVGARTGLAALAALSSAPHEGLGSAITNGTGVGTLVAALVLAGPAIVWPAALDVVGVAELGTASGHVAGAVGALLGALGATALVGWWAQSRLGGPNGDVFGAASEIARVVGLHVGVIAWTLS